MKLTKSTEALPTKTKTKPKLGDNLILSTNAEESRWTQHNWNQNEIGCWGLTKFLELENQHRVTGPENILIVSLTPDKSRDVERWVGSEGARPPFTSDQLQQRGYGREGVGGLCVQASPIFTYPVFLIGKGKNLTGTKQISNQSRTSG